MKAILFFILILVIIVVFGCEAKKHFSQKVITLCGTESKLKCYGDCDDGIIEVAYYDSTNQQLNEHGGFSLTQQEIQASFAVHLRSQCGECYNKFQLKKNNNFDTVECEEFFQTIEDTNKSCNGCVNVISAGCC